MPQAAPAPTTRRAVLAGAIALTGAATATAAVTVPAADAFAALLARAQAAADRSESAWAEFRVLEHRCAGIAGAGPKGDGSPAENAEWLARWERAKAKMGLDLAQAACYRRSEHMLSACAALAAVQAVTLEQILAKARLAHRMWNADLTESLVTDLVALGDAGRA